MVTPVSCFRARFRAFWGGQLTYLWNIITKTNIRPKWYKHLGLNVSTTWCNNNDKVVGQSNKLSLCKYKTITVINYHPLSQVITQLVLIWYISWCTRDINLVKMILVLLIACASTSALTWYISWRTCDIDLVQMTNPNSTKFPELIGCASKGAPTIIIGCPYSI